MEVFCEEQNNTIVAYLNGELDHHSAEYTRVKLDYYIDTSTSKNLVFDFKNVTFMDSSGIGIIIGRHKKISAKNGQVFLVNLNNTIKKVIELSGINKIVKVHGNLTEVLKNA